MNVTLPEPLRTCRWKAYRVRGDSASWRMVALSAVLASIASIPEPVTAQALRVHEVGFGIALSLPASWEAAADSTLTAVREESLAFMRESGVVALREIAARNENALLFRAADPARPTNSASVNVSVGEGWGPDILSTSPASDIAELVRQVCTIFDNQLQARGGTGGCDSNELITLENRSVLVIYQTASIPSMAIDNHRVAAMFPSTDLTFTLNVSIHRSQYDRAVIRAILASVRFPDGL